MVMMAITITVPSRPIFLTVDSHPLYGHTLYMVRCKALVGQWGSHISHLCCHWWTAQIQICLVMRTFGGQHWPCGYSQLPVQVLGVSSYRLVHYWYYWLSSFGHRSTQRPQVWSPVHCTDLGQGLHGFLWVWVPPLVIHPFRTWWCLYFDLIIEKVSEWTRHPTCLLILHQGCHTLSRQGSHTLVLVMGGILRSWFSHDSCWLIGIFCFAWGLGNRRCCCDILGVRCSCAQFSPLWFGLSGSARHGFPMVVVDVRVGVVVTNIAGFTKKVQKGHLSLRHTSNDDQSILVIYCVYKWWW